MLPQLRLLPVTIGVIILALGLRVGDMWQIAGQAWAQTAKPAAAAPAASPGASPPAAAPPAAAKAPGSPAAAAAPPAAAKAPGSPAAATATAAPGDDPTAFTPAEIEVLQGLSSRRAALDGRVADIERREALLKAAEQSIAAKIQELRQLQASLEVSLRHYDEQEEARKKSLVKIFETMKPKDAARIFEQMDMPTLVELIERMREARVAPVFAEMNPVRAKQVTAEIARRRQPAPAAEASPAAAIKPGQKSAVN
jgi:flagellar motility protein MotE (MotC chaperone)